MEILAALYVELMAKNAVLAFIVATKPYSRTNRYGCMFGVK